MIPAIVLSLRLLWLELRCPGAIDVVAFTMHPVARQGFARDLRIGGVPAVLLAVASWAWVPGPVAFAGSVVGLWGMWAMWLADTVDA